MTTLAQVMTDAGLEGAAWAPTDQCDNAGLLEQKAENQERAADLYTQAIRKKADLAEAHLNLAVALQAMGEEENISFIDTPGDIRDKYQYFTEADMSKLRAAGFDAPFTSVRDGVTDYVQRFLSTGDPYR